jgi:hypothetical protein
VHHTYSHYVCTFSSLLLRSVVGHHKFFHELKDVRLSADSSGELDVFDHDGAALGVYGEQVRVLHEDSQVHFSRLLHHR